MSIRERISQAWGNRPSACARRRAAARSAYAAQGITEYDVTVLADYNGRRARGVVHTSDMDKRMADLQRRFDRAARAWGAP